MESKAISTVQKRKELLATLQLLGSHGKQPLSGSAEGLAAAPPSCTWFVPNSPGSRVKIQHKGEGLELDNQEFSSRMQ